MKFRKPLKITSRSSTITNTFVQAIIPSVKFSAEEKEQALAILGMSSEKMSCAYCGGKAREWDHLRPLVRGKEPTGFISEIRNLVPACSDCNQSKSGSDWRVWMEGKAPNSPKTRGVLDIAERIERLNRFEKWGDVKPLDLSKLADESFWTKHWEYRDAILALMVNAQKHADDLKESIQTNLPSHAKM